jgi:pimeloyl-ACP methyl ester carboxylesterase
MGIEKAHNGEIELAYERMGHTDGMPLLLLNGAGTQMAMWPQDFCAALVQHGFQVARMDTREHGRSTYLSRYDVPRRQRPPLYTLADLTDDVVAVLDALGWATAYLLGASEGGMLAQATATYHPDRVAGLISVSATPTSSPLVNRPKLLANLKAFRAMHRTSTDREAEGQKWVDVFRAVGSPGYPLDEAHWREFGRQAFDHGLTPAGYVRVPAAIFAAGDRRRELAAVSCPTLVIHGEADPMCSVRGGRATAEAIPGARLVTYPGMGHDLPRELWPAMLDEVSALAARAEADTARGDARQCEEARHG